jgi:hypothetical protein
MKKLVFLISMMAISFVSCNKDDQNLIHSKNRVENGSEKKETHSSDNIKGNSISEINWTEIAEIVIRLAEGQFSGTKTIYPDGRIEYNGDCSGWGVCAMGGIYEGEPISDVYNHDFDHEMDGVIGVTEDDEVVIGVKNEAVSQDAYQALFYDENEINISKVYTVDNDNLLDDLSIDYGEDIIIEEGDYTVQKSGGYTYFVIHEL